jgi:phage gpG-like protein
MAFNFQKKMIEFRLAKTRLPVIVANATKNHFVKGFRDGGFTDEILDPWEARKTKNKSDRRTNKVRAILVKTGALRGSIRVMSATFDKIEVGTDLVYAARHNQGLAGMPQRKFIGSSAQLTKKIRLIIRNQIKSIL